MALFEQEFRSFINDKDKVTAMRQKIANALCKGDLLEAHELFQKTQIRLFNKLVKLGKKVINKSFEAYFMMTAKNIKRDEERHKKTKKYMRPRRDLKNSSSNEEIVDGVKNTDFYKSKEEFIRFVEENISNETDRLIFFDKTLNRLTYKQMVEKYREKNITNKSGNPFTVSALKVRVLRVKETLRKKYPKK